MNIKKLLISSLLVFIIPFLFYGSILIISIPYIIIFFFESLIFVLIFALFYKGIPGEGIKKGIIYSLLIWTLDSLIKFLYNLTGPDSYISNEIIFFTLIIPLIISILRGLVIGFIYKK